MRGADQEFTFWVERFARLTRVNHLSAIVLGDQRYAPYVIVLLGTVLERPIPTAFNYFLGKSELIPFLWWKWPGVLWWLIPAVLVFSVVFLRLLRNRYDRAIHIAGKSRDSTPIVEPGFSLGLQSVTLVFGLVGYGIWLSTAFNQLFATNPIYTIIRWGFIIPFIYVPIATDLAAAYLHVELVLPLRIRKAEVELDFSDPRRLGGMYPVGRVMRFTAMAAFIALSLYTIYWSVGFTLLPTLTPPADRHSILVVFVIVWALSIIVPTAGVYLIHQRMAASREAQLNGVLSRTRELGDDKEVFPYTSPGNESERQIYLEEYVKLDLVERTRTVPFNVAYTWELIIGALFPVTLQIVTLVLEPL